jgi:hypothetical protein
MTYNQFKNNHMKKQRYKIKVTLNRYGGYQAVLCEFWFKIPIINFEWWIGITTARGSKTTIKYYLRRWKSDYGLVNEDIENLTGEVWHI